MYPKNCRIRASNTQVQKTMINHIIKTITALTFLMLPAFVAGQEVAEEKTAWNYTPIFEEKPCPFEATPEQLSQIRCSWLTVPENRDKPDGRTLKLAVAVVSSLSENPEPDPLVYIPGGPGTAGFHLADGFLSSEFRNERELIFFDPRGVGLSDPKACTDLTRNWWNASYFSGSEPDELRQEKLILVNRCKKEIEEKNIDLSQFNTAANVHDLEYLRKALGYEQWNLWGRSYGSRVALEAMRIFPDPIRSVVLDGPSPPNVTKWTPDAGNFLDILNHRLADCKSDPQCNAVLPNLRVKVWSTFHSLKEDPWIIETGDREILPQLIVLSEASFAFAIYSALNRIQTSAMVPLMIDRFTERDESFIINLLPRLDRSSERRSWWVHLSVNCFEKLAITEGETSGGSGSEIELLEEVGFGRDDRICDTLHPYRIDPVHLEPVVSDIPVLILAGEYDPATHRSYGWITHETLSRSQLAEIPGAGHDSAALFPCTLNFFKRFLDDPDAELDMTCLETMPRTVFVTDPAVVFGSRN